MDKGGTAMTRREKVPKTRKDSQLVLRINGDERDTFVRLCEGLDTSAAREIRRFIRGFVAQHAEDTAPNTQGPKEKMK